MTNKYITSKFLICKTCKLVRTESTCNFCGSWEAARLVKIYKEEVLVYNSTSPDASPITGKVSKFSKKF